MKSDLILMAVLFMVPAQLLSQAQRLEQMQSKTILVFTPHPDDDVFGAGGTIALLNRNHNRVYVVVYTNDDKGSYDPEMSSQRLAGIRKSEEEASEGLLGTAKENISWMGYDDGMLEYAPQPKLTEEATAIIRRIRPDVLLTVDPGEWFERWHKTLYDIPLTLKVEIPAIWEQVRIEGDGKPLSSKVSVQTGMTILLADVPSQTMLVTITKTEREHGQIQ